MLTEKGNNNVYKRIGELRDLKDGWFDWEEDSKAYDSEQLNWLAWCLVVYYSRQAEDADLPIIFPVPSGEVQFEWVIEGYEPSLNINLNRKTGYWHVMDPDGKDAIAALGLDLSCDDTWDWLAKEIRRYRQLAVNRLDI